MGKRLIQQKRGRGGPTYRAPSFRYKGEVKHNKLNDKTISGEIIDLISCQGHSSPLAQVKYENGEKVLVVAPEGIKVGDRITSGIDVAIKSGNTLPLKSIPEGTAIYNIESNPGDGGKFVRTSGGSAKIVTKMANKIIVKLPSNRQKEFKPNCRACIGTIAGSGRTEKPFVKAGTKYFAKKAKNKLWPIVSGVSMNALDHPFGGSKSATKGRPLQSGRDYSPGRKVGNLAPQKKKKK
jgi:large subunit ribosomal protein L2